MDSRIKLLAKTALKAAQEIKAKDIIGVDLEGVESYTDFILIASGGSDRQTRALADNIINKIFEKHGIHPLGIEGYTQGEWILIDFGDIVAHVFFEGSRKMYHLEDMWLQATPLPEAALLRMLAARKATTGKRKITASPVRKVAVRKSRK